MRLLYTCTVRITGFCFLYSHHQTSAVKQRRGSQPSGTFKEETERRKRKLEGRKEKRPSCSTYYSPVRASDLVRDLHGCFFTFLTSSLVYFNVSTKYKLEENFIVVRVELPFIRHTLML